MVVSSMKCAAELAVSLSVPYLLLLVVRSRKVDQHGTLLALTTVGRRESVLEAWAVNKWARPRGIVVAKLSEVAGIPDRIFFVPGGKPIIIEFKKEGKTGKNLQEYTQPWYLKTLIAAGYRAYTCDTKEQFLEIMKRYDKCRMKESLKPSTKNRE